MVKLWKEKGGASYRDEGGGRADVNPGRSGSPFEGEGLQAGEGKEERGWVTD